MYSLLLFLATATGPTEAEVVTDEKTYVGSISLSDGKISIARDGNADNVPKDQVRAIYPRPRRDVIKTRTGVWGALVGGSRFRTESVQFGQRGTRIGDGNNGQQIDNRLVQYLRFSAPDRRLDEQWAEILAAKSDGDTLVIRRPNNVLDRLEGVVSEINDDTVSFDFDGETIPVKRSRVDGVVFFHSSDAPTLAPAVGTLKTTDGDSWVLAELRLEGTQWKGITASGLPISTSFADLHAIEFARSDSVFLSDLEIDEFSWRPLVAIPGMTEQLQKLERPRINRGFASEKLKLWWDESGGRVRPYEKGLAITSRTELTYRIRGEYRQLVSLVGIDADHRSHGHVQLTVLGDGKPLLDEAISGDQSAREIQVNLTGVRRLMIRVDFGESLDFGDYLNMCDARLIK